MEECLKIYFIERDTDYIGYSENIDCVIIAKDVENAYTTAFSDNGDRPYMDWGEENKTLEDFKKNTKITLLGNANESQETGIISINNVGD